MYLTAEGIEHSRTKTPSPQSNGTGEYFHRTVHDEFYAVAFRKKLYQSVEKMQQNLDEWIRLYNKERNHSGKCCFGKISAQTFADNKHLAKEKMLNKLHILSMPVEAESGSSGEQLDRNSLVDGDVM